MHFREDGGRHAAAQAGGGVKDSKAGGQEALVTAIRVRGGSEQGDGRGRRRGRGGSGQRHHVRAALGAASAQGVRLAQGEGQRADLGARWLGVLHKAAQGDGRGGFFPRRAEEHEK